MMSKSVVLSGMMGSGKSTVAPLVASRLGLAWVDSDKELEKRAGATVAELWTREGERAFRERERSLTLELLGGPPIVIACGGGALVDPQVRRHALERAFVITLGAEPETLATRVGRAADRPLLSGADAEARLRELLAARAAAYAECHGALATDDVEPDAVADAVVAILRREPIVVALGARSYVVDVVTDRPDALTDAVAKLAPSSLVVVTDAHVYRAQHARLEASLAPLAMPGTLVTLTPGEPNKRLSAVSTIWDGALGAGVDRGAAVLAFGGGVVGDLAGFAAATLLRGVRWIQAPTTVLAMVDASVGGKTGFDHSSGKNLIGAFHQPAAVVIDLATLSTLSARERVAGLAEVVKIALLRDGALFERLEASASALAAGDAEALMPIVRRSVELKAAIVRDDELEAGARAELNLGHTLGHALEAAGRYVEHLHGEAVAAGLVREMEWAAGRGLTPEALVARTRALFARLGLSIDVSSNRWLAARPFAAADKKRAGALVRVPVVRELGRATLEAVPLSALERAFGAHSA